MGRRTKDVTVTLTAAQAEALLNVANRGIAECPEYANGRGSASDERECETARRALERLQIARDYRPQRIAGRVGYATIDGKGSLS